MHWIGFGDPVGGPSPDVFVSVFSFTDVLTVNDKNDTPQSFILFQPYPNPFNPSTNIRYYLPESGFIEIRVYSLTGQKIETLFMGNKEKGMHNLLWNAKSRSSGLYFIELKTQKGAEMRKAVLLK